MCVCVPLFLPCASVAALSCGDGLGLLVVYIAQPDEDTAAVFGQDSDGGLGLDYIPAVPRNSTRTK